MKGLLFHPQIIMIVFIINLIGTIYGYYWYLPQLMDTPLIFTLFVPDSPTASLFFTIFLYFYMKGKNVPVIEALAFVSLLKYGIWAVVMNLLTFNVSGTLSWQGYMLMASHGAMALQALLYSPLYKIKLRHLSFAALFVLHNEIIDYVYGMMPVYGSLTEYSDHIGYFTFWLSIICILTVYYVSIYRKQKYDIAETP
ncbi:Uncharacterized membrane protein YpjA [Gracilibacillus ureilyticus]|uniref:Uncharacterized membrane protein YpjA n=1 Tax=Gracilibacillus ureilyticus TaxID=531814 RepID=A0A1H9LNX8_9BACI|nr:DUF1405 domain-containing protein [Gracilibacillus ureilyticus]SER12927.1 Uncharacterized membrane protein YpjA [Gracilibacillus ureilyticus]